ncbi:MAG: SDR family oxidoreductase [Ferruginibacter sp.]
MSYNLLKGKKGIIFGALDEKSIAWITAIRCFEEGAELILTNAPVAMRMGEINKLAEKVKAPVIPCDVSNAEDVENLITKSMEHFGGSFDFILHSIGMSVNVRKGKHYTEIDYTHNLKTFEISSMSLAQGTRNLYEERCIE